MSAATKGSAFLCLDERIGEFDDADADADDEADRLAEEGVGARRKLIKEAARERGT